MPPTLEQRVAALEQQVRRLRQRVRRLRHLQPDLRCTNCGTPPRPDDVGIEVDGAQSWTCEVCANVVTIPGWQ
jgi:hypothetical protein